MPAAEGEECEESGELEKSGGGLGDGDAVGIQWVALRKDLLAIVHTVSVAIRIHWIRPEGCLGYVRDAISVIVGIRIVSNSISIGVGVFSVM